MRRMLVLTAREASEIAALLRSVGGYATASRVTRAQGLSLQLDPRPRCASCWRLMNDEPSVCEDETICAKCAKDLT